MKEKIWIFHLNPLGSFSYGGTYPSGGVRGVATHLSPGSDSSEILQNSAKCVNLNKYSNFWLFVH